MKGPFQVAEDEPGCAHCGQGKTWTVVDAEDTAIGQSWGQDSEGDCPPDAYEMANLLNAVYEAALRHQVCNVPEGWRLVPTEPTEHMQDEAARELGLCKDDANDPETRQEFRVCYRAMVFSAPHYEFVACNKQEAP